MGGTVNGGRKAAATNKKRYDEVLKDRGGFYPTIGRTGGLISRGGGFSLTGDPKIDEQRRAFARECGAKGGESQPPDEAGGGMNNAQTQNKRGEWVPSIPLPYYELKKRCDCGKRFWTMDGYRGHYAYAHILGMEGDRKGEQS